MGKTERRVTKDGPVLVRRDQVKVTTNAAGETVEPYTEIRAYGVAPIQIADSEGQTRSAQIIAEQKKGKTSPFWGKAPFEIRLDDQTREEYVAGVLTPARPVTFLTSRFRSARAAVRAGRAELNTDRGNILLKQPARKEVLVK